MSEAKLFAKRKALRNHIPRRDIKIIPVEKRYYVVRKIYPKEIKKSGFLYPKWEQSLIYQTFQVNKWLRQARRKRRHHG